MRNLIGAVGTAVLVPVGLLVAVAVAAGVGGGGLGGLGQLVGGPTLPGQDPVVIALGGTDGSATGASEVPAVPRDEDADRGRRSGRDATEPTSGSRPGSARGTRGGGGGEADSSESTAGTTGGGAGPQSVRQPAGASPAPAATPAPSTGGDPAPAPAPPPDPLGDVVRGVGQTVDGLVRPLPVVGPPAADAVGTVIDLVAPPRNAAPPATPAP